CSRTRSCPAGASSGMPCATSCEPPLGLPVFYSGDWPAVRAAGRSVEQSAGLPSPSRTHPMNRSLLTAALLLGTSAAGAADPLARPNVLVVLTDDQGLGDFSFTGNPVLKTPNMDRFAREAVRFTDFHVAPMCSPTRGQL